MEVSAASKRLLPWLVAVAFFMESLDTTILNTAVPTIAAALKVAPAQHESGVVQLHTQPGGLHSDQRLDGGSIRDAPRVRLGHRALYLRIVALRHIEQHPCAGGVPRPARLRRRHDGAGGAADPGANIRQIRTHPRHELRRHSGPGGSHARTDRRRPDRRIFSLASHLFREHSDRPDRLVPGLSASARLPRKVESAGRCRPDPLWLGHRAAVLCAGGVRRTYAERGRDCGSAGDFHRAAGGIRTACVEDRVSAADSEPVSAFALFARR